MADSAALLLQWNPQLDTEAARAVIQLVDATVGDGGTLGHAEPMSPQVAADFIARLARRIDEGDVNLLLGRCEGEPAFMVMMSQSTMPNCRHTAELTKAVAHPKWRGQRLVERGLRALIDRAAALGVEQFVLDVREGSRAHLLWQRFGFVSYGVLDDYARINGQRHRGHYMVQALDVLRARLASAPTFDEIIHSPETAHAA